MSSLVPVCVRVSLIPIIYFELIPVKYFSITYLELIPAKTIDFWLIPVKSRDTPSPPTPYWIVASKAFGAIFTGIESYGLGRA